MRISDHSTDAKIKATEDHILPVVFDEGDNFTARLTVRNILDVIIDSCILKAFHCVCKNFRLHSSIFKSHLAPSVAVALDPRHEEEGLHLLVDAGQEDDILGRILKHLFTKRSLSMPNCLIEFHFLRNVYFIGVLHISAEVLL